MSKHFKKATKADRDVHDRNNDHNGDGHHDQGRGWGQQVKEWPRKHDDEHDHPGRGHAYAYGHGRWANHDDNDTTPGPGPGTGTGTGTDPIDNGTGGNDPIDTDTGTDDTGTGDTDPIDTGTGDTGTGDTGTGDTGTGSGGTVTPPPPPPPAPAVISLIAASVSDASTNDAIAGTDAGDTITGGAGNDTLMGGLGDDVIFGDGYGSVTVPLSIDASLDNAADPDAFTVLVSGLPNGASLSAGTDNGDGSWTLTPADLAGLTITASDSSGFTLDVVATATDGSDLTAASQLAVTLAAGIDDVIDDGAGNDILDGGWGNDVLTGGAGNDTVYGGAGDDMLIAGADNDAYFGDEGFDTIDYSGGTATQFGGMSINLLTGVVSGSANGTGSDRLYGIEGVIGSNGGDQIYGNALANTIDGAAGNDTIIAGRGADTLTGGAGIDTFIIRYDDVLDAAGNWQGADTITDLQIGDTLMLEGLGGFTLQDDGQSSALFASVNGQSVQVAVLEGVTGLSLDQMTDFGMIYY